MNIYNITTIVSWSVHDQWKNWLTEKYLPEILSTGLFTHYQLVRLMEVNEEDGPTYAVQIYCADNEKFKTYREKHLLNFERKEKQTWGDNVCSFPSLMEVIN